MSGIEIVGVLLGAFPLLVTAFQLRKELSKAKKLLLQWEIEYGKCLNGLQEEQLFFRQNLQLMICPLVQHDGPGELDLEALLANPGGPGWRDNDLQEALERRLGDAFPCYMRIMTELQASIMSLLRSMWAGKAQNQKRLDLGPEQTSPRHKLMRLANKEFLDRIEQFKFCIKRPQMEEVLVEIRSNNQKLARLLDGCDKLSSKLQKSKTLPVPQSISRSLLKYWEHADRIYRLVQDSWMCACKQQHCAQVLLYHPVSRAEEMNMMVFWTSQHSSSSCDAAWQPHDLQISWSGAIPQRSEDSAILDFRGNLGDMGADGRKAQKRTRFSEDTVNIAKLSKNCALGDAASSAKEMVSDAQALPRRPGLLTNLCEEMAKCIVAPAHLGALANPDDGIEYYVCARPDSGKPIAEISLHDVLQQSPCRKRIRRSDRFQIGLALASSHLKLRSTPWARRQWEGTDIYFAQDVGAPDRIDFERPYVSASFDSALPEGGESSPQPDRSFVALGIMLLELLFDCLLEEHEMWKLESFSGRERDPICRLMVATMWAEEVQYNVDSEYEAAVRWCLRPDTLGSDRWRKEFADKVVMPLQRSRGFIKAKPVLDVEKED